MYSPDQTKALQKLTTGLMEKNSQGHIADKDIETLRDVLRFHEHRYYIQNDPLIADFEYDQLYKALENLEKENPALRTPDSPTQRVAKELTAAFPTVSHLVPMLSLDNSYNADDLIDFDRRARELAKVEVLEYCVEPKFDGASISLIFENDMLVRGATRGNGVQGDDITTNIKQIRSIPLSAAISKHGLEQIEIRGEVLMSKQNFKKYNDALAEQNLAPLANPRNAAAGTLRIKDPKEVSKRNLEAFLYQISHYTQLPGKEVDPIVNSHSGCLTMLWDLGFRSPVKEKKVLKGIEAVVAYCHEFEQQRDDLPYEIDGMVIKVNDIHQQELLGMTTHHPRWAIAYKFKARQATSKLRAVEFQVGRTGSVTPVAKIDPVPIGGVTVGSVSLFNEEVIKDKDLMIGDTVLVERAGDVIPYIVKSLPELRNGTEQKIVFPTTCPVCGDKLEKPEEEAVWRCSNINCEAQVVERIIHYTGKDAMDIRGLGEANIRKFFSLGFLKDVPGIYELPFDKIGTLEGFGKKSITNLQTAIETSKAQPIHRLLFALGIRYVGETTAKTLAHAVKHLLDLKDYSLEDLQNLEDIGPKVAGSVHQFFQNLDNIATLQKLEQLGLKLKNDKKDLATGGNLSGQTFLFTGTLPTLKRSDAEAMVESNGGKLLNSVSANLTYLVAGEEAGSKLEKAKKITSIKIITEAEFLSLIHH
jgi:DNA ligase (NAD+)